MKTALSVVLVVLVALCAVLIFRQYRQGDPLAQIGSMPIRASWRKADASQGSVLQLRNAGHSAMRIQADMASADGSKHAGPLFFSVDAGKTQEIGQTEGWEFAHGDTAQIAVDGFPDMRFECP
jgi:hypothetical protein